MNMGRCACILAVGAALFSLRVSAEDFDAEFDEKPWSEISVQLPAFPDKDNLIPFRVGAIFDKQFFVDGKSLSVGSDQVIRYTVVIISSSGAQNISFEGMRCSTAERRLYAFGRADKTWSKARKNQWEKLHGDTNQYPVELWSNYLCKIGGPVITTGEDVRQIFIRARRQEQ